MTHSTSPHLFPIGPSIAYVPVGRSSYAVIDACDSPLVKPYRWNLMASGSTLYALSTTTGKTVYMHRLIGVPPSGMLIDHRNMYGLDNRRGNLRPATRSTNAINYGRPKNNKTGARGVWLKHTGRYTAELWHQNKKYFIGVFDTMEEARDARDTKCRELFGEFARSS